MNGVKRINKALFGLKKPLTELELGVEAIDKQKANNEALIENLIAQNGELKSVRKIADNVITNLRNLLGIPSD